MKTQNELSCDFSSVNSRENTPISGECFWLLTGTTKKSFEQHMLIIYNIIWQSLQPSQTQLRPSCQNHWSKTLLQKNIFCQAASQTLSHIKIQIISKHVPKFKSPFPAQFVDEAEIHNMTHQNHRKNIPQIHFSVLKFTNLMFDW